MEKRMEGKYDSPSQAQLKEAIADCIGTYHGVLMR